MNFLDYKPSFDSLMGVKSIPNEREVALFARAEKYIRKISWIPGLRMIAVVNSLSMYATHESSDIDLFVITAKNRMWFVRVLITLVFWLYGVWRYGEDVAGNFCLSFFIEEDAMDMSRIALEDDIYLFFWMYYMKPILVVGDMWERFKMVNGEWGMVNENKIIVLQQKSRVFDGSFLNVLNTTIRFLGEWKARRSYEKKGRPEGVIISRNILKFHDQDRRREISEKIFGKSIDK